MWLVLQTQEAKRQQERPDSDDDVPLAKMYTVDDDDIPLARLFNPDDDDALLANIKELSRIEYARKQAMQVELHKKNWRPAVPVAPDGDCIFSAVGI